VFVEYFFEVDDELEILGFCYLTRLHKLLGMNGSKEGMWQQSR
jgi:hypothetical protein